MTGDIESDKHVLLNLKSKIQLQNPGRFDSWNSGDRSPCNWPGISCDRDGNHVTAIDLSNYVISRLLFRNFSALPELRSLDLSQTGMSGAIPNDLGNCRNLRDLNLSNNFIRCRFHLSGLDNLEVLHLLVNRMTCSFQAVFREISCRNLVSLNL